MRSPLWHCVLLSAVVPLIGGFTSPLKVLRTSVQSRLLEGESFVLYATEDKKQNPTPPGGLDESVRTRLLSESIAPWRSLRLFLYGSFASGALIGGLITLSGAAAVMSGAKEGDMNVEVGAIGTPPAGICLLIVVFPMKVAESGY